MSYRVYWNTEKSMAYGHKFNQDSLMFSEYSFMSDGAVKLMIVADGMGGLAKGEVASRNAVTGFLETFYSRMLDIYLKKKMEGFSLRYTVDEIEKVCRESEKYESTGTTISVVCVVGDLAVYANVGDSPIYFYRNDQLEMVSKLQTLAELNAEKEKYERYSSEYYDDEHILYCYLGEYENLSEEYIICSSIGKLKKGDSFLIGSDGAFGRIKDDDLRERLSEYLSDEDSEGFFLEQLFQEARVDKDDDQTAILYVVA